MSGTTLIYVKGETRIRLKALAHLDGRLLMEYVDRLAKREVQKIDPQTYRFAVEKVTAGPKDGT